MRISLRFLPVALFFAFYALIQVSFTSLRHFQDREDEKENKAIQEIVVDRFKRYLEYPLKSWGTTVRGADLFL